ncbi:hypothetical protein JCM18237_08310 [Halorubrum luteum]
MDVVLVAFCVLQDFTEHFTQDFPVILVRIDDRSGADLVDFEARKIHSVVCEFHQGNEFERASDDDRCDIELLPDFATRLIRCPKRVLTRGAEPSLWNEFVLVDVVVRKIIHSPERRKAMVAAVSGRVRSFGEPVFEGFLSGRGTLHFEECGITLDGKVLIFRPAVSFVDIVLDSGDEVGGSSVVVFVVDLHWCGVLPHRDSSVVAAAVCEFQVTAWVLTFVIEDCVVGEANGVGVSDRYVVE